MKLEHRWVAAMIKADTAELDNIESDDFIVIDPSGTISSKAEDMKNVKTGNLKFDAIDIKESKVRVHGDTAIVTGKAALKGNFKSQDIGGNYSFTDVFVKIKGEWRAVSSHITRVME